jgi:hypothetical protein
MTTPSTLAIVLMATLLFPVAGQLNAQHAMLREYTLGSPPTVPDQAKNTPFSTVVLERNVVVDIEDEGQDVFEYHLLHHSIYLHDASAIESENKVYVNLNQTLDVVKVQARSIAPDGKVHELGKEAFKRATDDEERGSYLYFAFEGLVPGSVIEYVHVLKRRPSFYGDYEVFQFGIPILKENIHLIHPERLVYKTKEFNGVPAPRTDTTTAGSHHLVWSMNDVPALEKEESAHVEAARMRISFALDRVLDRGLRDYSGYLNATKFFHSMTHQELDKKTAKEVSTLIKRMDIPKGASEADKVRAVEDHLKLNFQVIEYNAPMLASIPDILKNKACSPVGMSALFCTILHELGIEHHLVITSDRSRKPFDPTFESYEFLDEFVLYLPRIDQYLSPTEPGLRLGYINSENTANHGLFIKDYDIGGAISGVGTVKYIPALPDTATVHDHIITADLSAGPDRCALSFTNMLTGYYAPIQCYFPLLDETRQNEAMHELVSYLVENGEVHELKVENAESRYFGVKPFMIKGRVDTRKFSASAGEKVLFKVGELIGPQVEMYTEKPRKLPVDDDYNRRFNRTIDIVLPEGWNVENLDDLAMEQHLDLDGQRQLLFKSTATQEANVVKVRVEEYYKTCQLPLEHFETYRRVINAAADFNKVVMVLVKG